MCATSGSVADDRCGTKEVRVRDDGETNGDKRISLAPLDFEDAMKVILQTGPHPKDNEPTPEQPRRRRKRHRVPEPEQPS